MARTVHPHLMFQNGMAEAAIRRYEEIFEDFTVDQVDTYPEGGEGPDGKVQHPRYGQLTDQFGVPWALNLT